MIASLCHRVSFSLALRNTTPPRYSRPCIVQEAEASCEKRDLRSRAVRLVHVQLEELVAEMGAAFLCAEAGISPAVIENQAAYVAGWLKKWPARHFLSNQQESIM